MTAKKIPITPVFLDLPTVAQVVALSTATIERLEREGRFPKRRQLSGQRVGWLVREVQEWAESRPVKRTYTAENKRKWALKTRYGLTPEQVEAMSIAQGGQCAVCKKPIEKFHIDHNHNTGAVRGLLCHRCNVRIGGWDDEAWLSSALRYMGVKP